MDITQQIQKRLGGNAETITDTTIAGGRTEPSNHISDSAVAKEPNWLATDSSSSSSDAHSSSAKLVVIKDHKRKNGQIFFLIEWTDLEQCSIWISQDAVEIYPKAIRDYLLRLMQEKPRRATHLLKKLTHFGQFLKE